MKIHSVTRLFLFVSFLLMLSQSQAQTPDSGTSNIAKQTDVIDLLHTVIKSKSFNNQTINPHPVSTLHLSVVPAVGYALQSGFAASISTNASFYTNRNETENLSVVNSTISFTQKNQFLATAQSNLWLKKNKINLVGDYRFMIYPQSTYGLGGHTQLSDETPMKYNFIRFSQLAYFNLRKELFAGFGYILNDHYNIRELITNPVLEGDPETYEKTSKTLSSGIDLNLLLDKRRNSNNPVAGAAYFNVQWINYLKQLGSDNNWQSLVVDARKYIGLGKQKKNKLALWGYGWFTFNSQAPYLDLPSTGWDMNSNLGRGYVQGRFRGKNLLYSEAEYRMTFTKNGLLGGVLFANAQSVSDYPGNRFTVVHPAVGTGLRIKFNKYSNTNIALDYAVGADGSKGVFVNLGEVF